MNNHHSKKKFFFLIYSGVSIFVPKGALPEGSEQEIYFKVCQDNSILPPLDKEKGKRISVL